MTYHPSVERFSEAYLLFSDARVIEYPSEYPVIANDTYEYLNRHVSRPLLKIGGSYFWPKSERTVPPDVVAVPEGTLDDAAGDEVLIATDRQAEELMLSGSVMRPTEL